MSHVCGTCMKITHGISVASECLRESPVCLPALVHLLDVKMKTLQGFEAYGVGPQIKHTHTHAHKTHSHAPDNRPLVWKDSSEGEAD